MLILTRKPNEAVVLSGGIRVIVLEVRGDKVSLGFEAPDSVGIRREEIAELIRLAEAAETVDDCE